MVNRRQDARREWLREQVKEGRRCPFCSSGALRVREGEDPVLKPDRFPMHEDLVRLDCGECGYVLIFGPPYYSS